MLKVEDLEVYYGGVHALKGISFEVPKGKIVSLIGINGAGKSTTLRAICGLASPKAGSILFEGKDITGMEPNKIVSEGIALVPEGRRVFVELSVKENLQMGAWLRKDSNGVDTDFERVFELFPVLKARSSQKAGTLSGGEQQMLAVGRAMMSNPRLLLMDEPSLGLAPLLVSQLFRTFEQVHESGMTILLIEQNARASLKIADYGYVLEVGRIVLEGTSEELSTDRRVQEAYIGG